MPFVKSAFFYAYTFPFIPIEMVIFVLVIINH